MALERVNTPINLNGLQLESRVMNGAGPCKLIDNVAELAASDASAIIVGSITCEPREGNSGTTYYSGEGYTLNSRGLPNPGLAYYQRHLLDMVSIAHDHGKPLIVSIAGFSPQEYADLAEAVFELGVDGLESNKGCPNVWGSDGQQKPIASFNEDLMGESLRRMEERVGIDNWISIKLSPYTDSSQLRSMARNVLSKSQIVKAVTTMNTMPNAYFFDANGKPVIDQGYAGLAGDAVLPIGLGQVLQLRAALPETVAVIGVGGVSKEEDVVNYLRAGASAVQITSAYINMGPSVFAQARGL